MALDLARTPLATKGNGSPLLWGALGMYIQLEPLRPEHAEHLERALDGALDWVGSSLRYSFLSTFEEVEPFRPDVLGYIPSWAEDLDYDVGPATGDDQDNAALGVLASARDEFALSCHGGDNEDAPSPFGLRFFGSIIDAREGLFQPASCLRISVPADWPLEDFYRHFVTLVDDLPTRWASAGYMLVGWEFGDRREYHRAVYAKARRHCGLDAGYYMDSVDFWHRELRTVNWLTLLGPSFMEALGKATEGPPLPANDALVQVSPTQHHMLLQAGPHPETGDVSRLQFPDAYVRADQLVRGLRARDIGSFFTPWTEQTTTEWLRRFERTGSLS